MGLSETPIGRARASPGRLVAGAARRPRLTLLVVALLVVAGGLLALRLEPSTSISTLVSSSSDDYRATQADARRFGGDAVIVLVREPVRQLVETGDLETLSELEACLSGQQLRLDRQLEAYEPVAPSGARPYGGHGSPCAGLMVDRPARVVYGPGTFLNRAVAAVGEQVEALGTAARTAITEAERTALALARRRGLSRSLADAAARAAGELEAERRLDQLVGLATGSGLSAEPAISDAAFIERIVFGAGSTAPKQQLRWLFPTGDSAIVQVRLRAGLSAAGEARAIALIRAAVRMPRFRLGHGGTYLVSGEPVVLSDLEADVTGSIAILLAGAIVAMGLVLVVVFRGSLRLLPLLLALAAAAITFGIATLAGATLTMASVAVLPVLIGLAVDYAIQFQSRARQADGPSPALRVMRAGELGTPAIVVAATATATGFLALLLSPVPMVRGFGLLLVVGVAVALALTLTAGAAALVLADTVRRPSIGLGWLGASIRGAGEILDDLARPLRRAAPVDLETLLARLTRHPGRVLAIALVAAAVGWAAGTRATVQSDVTKLVPSSMPALRALRTVERVTGTSGEIDVLVHAPDVATPRVLGWMTRYEAALLSHFGYGDRGGCRAATLCPALSLPDLVTGGGGGTGDTALTAHAIDSLLAAVPGYFSRAVITSDRRYATLGFGIRLMPLVRQQAVVRYMRERLAPPPGVRASLAGLPVLAADAAATLSSPGRRLLTVLAGLLAVALVLAIVLRRPRRVVVPLVPIVLATGWSSLVVFVVGIPLNPMSATLGTLVIAISTEFSVLLSERVAQERRDTEMLLPALARAYRSTGSAVLASGLTATAGFGVLVASNIQMLRDFGAITVVDLAASLAGVLVVLPAVAALADRRPVRRRADARPDDAPAPAISRRAPAA